MSKAVAIPNSVAIAELEKKLKEEAANYIPDENDFEEEEEC